MANSKVTILVNGSTDGGDIVWGFSESWWFNSDNAPGLFNKAIEIAQQRANLLPKGCTVIGARVNTPDGRAVSRDFVGSIGGIAGPAANGDINVPQDAVTTNISIDGGRLQPRFTLHSLPDDAITKGRAVNNVWIPAIKAYFLRLSRLGAQYRKLVALPAAPAAPSWALISSISPAGVVATFSALNVQVGKYVQLLAVRDLNGKSVRGSYFVTSIDDATHFTVANWPNRTVGRSGRVRIPAYEFITLDAADLSTIRVLKAGSRKVGRPFGLLHGRARRGR